MNTTTSTGAIRAAKKWIAVYHDDRLTWVVGCPETNIPVATIVNRHDKALEEATARLIAASPKLLEALEECERRLSRIACGELSGMAAKHSAKSGLETIRAAIAATT